MSLVLSVHYFFSVHVHHDPGAGGDEWDWVVEVEVFCHRFEEFSEARVIISIEYVIFVLIILDYFLLHRPLAADWLIRLIVILRVALIIIPDILRFVNSSLSLTCGPMKAIMTGAKRVVIVCGCLT